MADNSLIEWTDTTWQIVTGCSVVSPGCTNCYAMKLAGTRMKNHPTRAGLTIDTKAGPVWNGQVRFNEAELTKPLAWRRPRKIFVAAHGDLFHEGVTDAQLDKVFAVAALAKHHVFQILTKRADRIRDYLTAPDLMARLGKAIDAQRLEKYRKGRPATPPARCEADTGGLAYAWGGGMDGRTRDYVRPWPLPNVWLGVSVEDQARADERIPLLLDTPAAVRWISAEPLLGPVDLQHIDDGCSDPRNVLRSWSAEEQAAQYGEGFEGSPGLNWVVVGGESGPGARPMHPDWARNLRDQCAAHGVPFMFKQWGVWAPGENATHTLGRTTDGATWFNDGWLYETFTAAASEGLHIDDEPTVWRAGKKAAGRRLDGVQHDGYPATSESEGR